MLRTKSLVDGATLSAVTRVLGESVSRSYESIDGDLSAFEGFLTAILFFDDLSYLKNKRTQHAIARIFKNGQPPDFLKPVELSDHGEVELLCQKAVSNDLLTISQKGLPDSSINRFLAAMDRTVATNWMVGASFNFKIYGEILDLSDEKVKHGPLVRMIFDCANNMSSSAVQKDRIDRESYREIGYDPGDPAHDIRFTEDFRTAVQSLNWLLIRTMFYSVIAKRTDANLAFHPIRSAFSAGNTLYRMGVPRATCEHVAELVSKEGMAVAKDVQAEIEPGVAALHLPFFSAWVAAKTDSPRQFVEEVLTMREQRPFVKARDIFRILQSEDHPRDVQTFKAKHNQFVREISECAATMRAKYNVTTPQGIPTTFLVTLINSIAANAGYAVQVPDLGIKLPGRLRTLIETPTVNPYKQIFRSAVNDLATIPRLGALHERLTKKMEFNVKARKERRWMLERDQP